jgi:hypothetical protein
MADAPGQLFDPDAVPDPPARPRARATDPETSHAAAASIAPKRQRATQLAVLELLRKAGPLHDYALIARYDEARIGHGWPPQTRSGLQTRRHELVTAGLVRDSGERILLETGRRAILWEATP